MHTIEEVVRETTDDPAELVDPYAAFAHEQVEWTTGVEHYQSISSRKLLKMLGCKTGQVPNFNAYLDQSKEHDPWDAEDASWFGEESADRVPLELRWHQLVGVVRMMDQFFLPADERAEEVVPSILLMDEVGLGKTLQVAAVVAFIIHFRDYYDKHGKFPGKYGALHCVGPLSEADELCPLLCSPLHQPITSGCTVQETFPTRRSSSSFHRLCRTSGSLSFIGSSLRNRLTSYLMLAMPTGREESFTGMRWRKSRSGLQVVVSF